MARYTGILAKKVRKVKTRPMDDSEILSFCGGIRNMLFRGGRVKKNFRSRRYYTALEKRAAAHAAEWYNTDRAVRDLGFHVSSRLADVIRELSLTMPMLNFYPTEVEGSTVAVFADGCDFPIGFISSTFSVYKIVSPIIFHESRKEARETEDYGRMMAMCRKEFKMVPPPWMPMFVAGCISEDSMNSPFSGLYNELYQARTELKVTFSNREIGSGVRSLLLRMYHEGDPRLPEIYKHYSDKVDTLADKSRKVILNYMAYVYADVGDDSVRVCMTVNNSLKKAIQDYWTDEEKTRVVDQARQSIIYGMASRQMKSAASPVVECPIEDLPDKLITKIGKASMLDSGECVLGTGTKLDSGEYMLYAGDLLRDHEVYRFFFDTEA